MAKVVHFTKTFSHSAPTVTRAATTAIGTHTAPNLSTDTLARTWTQFHFGVTVDATGNVPPYDWWQTARLNLALQFNKNGSSVPTANEGDPSVFAWWVLYPEPFYDTQANGLYGVRFTPREQLLETRSRHKSDGTAFAKLLWVLYLHDSSGVLTNLGGLYSTTSAFAIYSKALWESDT